MVGRQDGAIRVCQRLRRRGRPGPARAGWYPTSISPLGPSCSVCLCRSEPPTVPMVTSCSSGAVESRRREYGQRAVRGLGSTLGHTMDAVAVAPLPASSAWRGEQHRRQQCQVAAGQAVAAAAAAPTAAVPCAPCAGAASPPASAAAPPALGKSRWRCRSAEVRERAHALAGRPQAAPSSTQHQQHRRQQSKQSRGSGACLAGLCQRAVHIEQAQHPFGHCCCLGLQGGGPGGQAWRMDQGRAAGGHAAAGGWDPACAGSAVAAPLQSSPRQ